MLSRIALTGALVVSCALGMLAQQSPSPDAYMDEDAYQIYDLLLSQSYYGPTVLIDAETYPMLSVKDGHGMGPGECIDPSVAAEFKDAISNYNHLNQNRWLLQRKFSLLNVRLLQREFSLLGSYELLDSAALATLPGRCCWELFQMSAVGFNKDKTRAVLYFAEFCGSLCGSWTLDLLKKVDGKWVIVPGVDCHPA